MGEVGFIVLLAVVTFGLAALWAWRSRKKAVKGLPEDHHLK